MNTNIDFLALITNSLITYICGGVTLYFIHNEMLKKHSFYYSWSIGFICYGTEILMRAFSFDPYLTNTMGFISYALFLFGLWSLTRTKNLLYLLITVYSSTILILIFWLCGIISFELSRTIGSPLLFLSLIFLVIYNRAKFGRTVDKFTLGWFFLILVNVLLYDKGWIAEAFAVTSKLIILLGIMDYDFLILTQKIREELVFHHLPINTGYKKEGGLNLITSSSCLRKIEWVSRKILENREEGIVTYLFSFQDTTPHRELRRLKWIAPEKVFVFLFSTSAEKAKDEFAVFPMGITEIGASLSEIIKKYFNLEERGCTVVFMDLSLLIHLFGAYPVYNLFLNKMGALREAGVQLFAFFHPETHSDNSIVSLFTNISDEVTNM